MGPYKTPLAIQKLRLPRASGDGPLMGLKKHPLFMVAPRERGWALERIAREERQAGCPARAGMGPTRATQSASNSGLPRASGDGPSAKDASAFVQTVAPRERGWALR